MLFISNINGLIINYINLNYQINKQIMLVVSYYPITNRIMFKFVNFNMIIIHVVFGLTNTVKYIHSKIHTY